MYDDAIRNSADADRSTVGIVIPTWNAERHWEKLSDSLAAQGVAPQQVLIIDSSSPDRTRELATQCGYRVIQIAREEFGHGKTRQAASCLLPTADLLVYLTQDVVFDSPDSISRLCCTMRDGEVGAAYGRQVPRSSANAIERHARYFNYPAVPHKRNLESRRELGIRAVFLSNSFAIYRRAALEAVGGFPTDVIFGEDSYVAGRLLMAGWTIAYEASATVVHSHALTLKQEFGRHFDIGVHHEREAWLLETFGTATGEGLRFLNSEMNYLRLHDAKLIPQAIIRTASKLLAYRTGRLWRRLPSLLNRRFSSNPTFWSQAADPRLH